MRYLSDSRIGSGRLINQMLIKEENKKCLFNLLSRNREMARADMVRVTGLSPTTVSALVEELVKDKLVVEIGYAKTMQIGRKPINLRINASGRQIPVFNYENDGVRFTLFNLRMEVLETLFVPHAPEQSGKSGAGAAFAHIIEDVLTKQSVHYNQMISAAVGICFPGAYLQDEGLLLSAARKFSIDVQPLKELEERIGTPFFIGNSWQAMAYAEKKRLDANASDSEDLIYINVGENVGTGIIYKDEVLSGSGGFAGEIGHVTINYRGQLCSCGRRGCLENYINLNAVVERISQIAKLSTGSSLYRCMEENGGSLSLEMIRDAYNAGDADVVEAVHDVAMRLLLGAYSVACTTGIGRVIIGGGIEQLGAGFLNRLRHLAEEDGAERLLYELSFDYGLLKPSEAGLGVAQYFVDKCFVLN